MRDLWRGESSPLRLLPGQRRRRGAADPFTALEVQYALARLDTLIETVRRDDARFAQAHHLRAAMIAYDGALAEACALAGVPLPEQDLDAVSRVQAEAELQARGWRW